MQAFKHLRPSSIVSFSVRIIVGFAAELGRKGISVFLIFKKYLCSVVAMLNVELICDFPDLLYPIVSFCPLFVREYDWGRALRLVPGGGKVGCFVLSLHFPLHLFRSR